MNTSRAPLECLIHVRLDCNHYSSSLLHWNKRLGITFRSMPNKQKTVCSF